MSDFNDPMPETTIEALRLIALLVPHGSQSYEIAVEHIRRFERRNVMDTIKQHLIDKGWGIDDTATENRSGELMEYIHPDKPDTRRAWLGAIYEEMMRELEAEELPVRIVNGKVDPPCGDDLGGNGRD